MLSTLRHLNELVVFKDKDLTSWGPFYISLKGHAILGPPLGPHKLSNIYTSPLKVVWWRTVKLLQSNGQKNICRRRGC